jgi:UDP:flavonoid glycosyltransferase YjiC (YdhE family)
MAGFLFTTLPTNDLGLLTRSLPIARELEHRGHRVSFCSPAEAPRHLIASAGFANFMPEHALYDLLAVEPTLGGLAGFLFGGARRGRHASLLRFLREVAPALPYRSVPRTFEVWDMAHAGAMMGMLNEGFVRAHCSALEGVIRRVDPDVVVDFWNPFAVIAARALGMPLVTVIQADAHPMSDGFIWWKPRPPGVPTPVPVVNRVLARCGLPPVRKLEDLSVGDLTLVVGMPESDPLPPEAQVSYVGSILWETTAAELPNSVVRLPRDKPLVWIYSGNPHYAQGGVVLDSAVLIEASIAALASEDLRVVLSTGYHSLPQSVLPLPDNFVHEPYVPGLAMATRSDLLIHHGGYGSCQTGLATGTPAVIVPTYAERESNARRVAGLGAGVIVPVDTSTGKKRVSADELRAAARRVLSDPSFAMQARRAGERLAELGGAARAAELIGGFAEHGGRRIGATLRAG